MDEILSIYLNATILEELPYVVGYCGEFRERIMQQAGPCQVPGLSVSFFIVTSSYQSSQAFLGKLLTPPSSSCSTCQPT